jgi:hypothetical protein
MEDALAAHLGPQAATVRFDDRAAEHKPQAESV